MGFGKFKPVYLFIFILLFLLLIYEVFANGAAFKPGITSSTPIIVNENRLILKKEHVVFKTNKNESTDPYGAPTGTVTARFWIENPTSKQIHIITAVQNRTDLATHLL